MTRRLSILFLNLAPMVSIAQTPAIPEPPLVVYGTVPPGHLAWQLSDGERTHDFDTSSVPAIRTFTQGGENSYLLEVPFETRSYQDDGSSRPLDSGAAFSLPADGTALTFVPSVGGAPVRVFEVDGVAQSPGSTSFTLSNHGALTAGGRLRVDLEPLGTPEYWEWAGQYFDSLWHPGAAPDQDPDGDGFTNAQEMEMGTDPLDPLSTLRLIRISQGEAASSVDLTWTSRAGKRYQVLSSPQPGVFPWTSLGPEVIAIGSETSTTVILPDQDLRRFFRVRINP